MYTARSYKKVLIKCFINKTAESVHKNTNFCNIKLSLADPKGSSVLKEWNRTNLYYSLKTRSSGTNKSLELWTKGFFYTGKLTGIAIAE